MRDEWAFPESLSVSPSPGGGGSIANEMSGRGGVGHWYGIHPTPLRIVLRAMLAISRASFARLGPLFGAPMRILCPSISNEIELLSACAHARVACLEAETWMAGQRRAEATPFFERLCAATTTGVGEWPRVDKNSDFDRSAKTRRERWRRQTRRRCTRSERSSCRRKDEGSSTSPELTSLLAVFVQQGSNAFFGKKVRLAVYAPHNRG